MNTPVEVFLGILAAVLVLIFIGIAIRAISTIGKKNRITRIDPPLPEAHMPVWHKGDHFIDHISHRSVSADIDNQTPLETGDDQLDDLLKHKGSRFNGFDPLEKVDHSIHGMMSHNHREDDHEEEIEEDNPLRR